MQTKNANNKMSASVPTYTRGFLDIARYRMSCLIAIVEVLGVILFEKVNGAVALNSWNTSMINDVHLASDDGTVGGIIGLLRAGRHTIQYTH